MSLLFRGSRTRYPRWQTSAMRYWIEWNVLSKRYGRLAILSVRWAARPMRTIWKTPLEHLPMKERNEMADFDLSKITGREPPLVTDDERDAEIAYLSDVVANRDRELAALRARVAELEADAERLNWLQANPRLSTIRLAGEPDRECYMYAVAGAPGLKLREIIDAARGLPANKTEVPK